MRWTQEHVDAFNAKKGKLPSKIPVIPVENSGKAGNSALNSSNSRPVSFALGRMKAGKMNKTEALYAQELERQKMAGEILAWWFEAINLRIGENCFYKPDFLVMMKSGLLELRETKGWMTDDALVKIRAVSEKYPFPIKVVKLVKGSWDIREF